MPTFRFRVQSQILISLELKDDEEVVSSEKYFKACFAYFRLKILNFKEFKFVTIPEFEDLKVEIAFFSLVIIQEDFFRHQPTIILMGSACSPLI